MYSIDYHHLVKEKSNLNLYLQYCEIPKNKNRKKFLSSNIKFKVGKKYPVIAYRLKFDMNGKINELQEIRKDVVEVKSNYAKYDKNNLYEKRKYEDLYELYDNSVTKNNGKKYQYDLYQINSHFESLLNNLFVKFIEREKLPFIYYGCSLPDEEKTNSNLNEILPILSYFNKAELNEIRNIFSSMIDVDHYSIYQIPNGLYDLRLMKSFDFLGIETQRMLSDLYFNVRRIDDPSELQKLKKLYALKYGKIVTELNELIKYTDYVATQKNKGKRKFKRY